MDKDEIPAIADLPTAKLLATYVALVIGIFHFVPAE